MKRRLSVLIGLLFPIASLSVESRLWQAFANGDRPKLPDFSYAGYKRGETRIPDVDWPVYNVNDYEAQLELRLGHLPEWVREIREKEKAGLTWQPGDIRIKAGEDHRRRSVSVRPGFGHQDRGIKPYAENPSYWEYRGKPLLLMGASDRDNIFQWAGDGTKLTDHLDLLRSCGGNYIRCTMSSREYTSPGYRWDLLPYPFAKTSGKYDLTQWNDVYWDKLRTFLTETQKRGIIVQLEFWDRWNECGDSRKPNSGWYCSPWNPNNNSTYDWTDSPLLKTGRTDFYNAFHYAAVQQDSVLLPLQKAFVKKVIDEVIGRGFDHVLFQIDNESGIGDDTLEPDPYWARFTRDYAASKGVDVYVCTSRRFHWPTPRPTKDFQDWHNPEIRVPIVNTAFNFCDLSQNNGNQGQQHYDNLIWYRSKVFDYGPRPVNHTKCYHFNWPTGTSFHRRSSPTDTEAGSKFWRAVFAGAASIRFHRHTPTRPGGLREGFGLSLAGQRHLRSMRAFIDVVDLFGMSPYKDLLSQRATNEAYCLAEPGQQYAVFFTGDGDRRVKIALAPLQYPLQLRWLDVATCHWVQKDLILDGGACTLKAPGSGHWVAVLTTVSP